MNPAGTGADKALVSLAGQPLIAHLLDRIAPQVKALAISANGDANRFAQFGLPVLPDDQSMGPLSGILSGMLWAGQNGADAVLSAPVDAPFLPRDLSPRLILAADGPGLALARSGGRLHPTCGLWPVSLAPALAAFLASGAKARVTDFANAHGAAIADFPEDGAFTNLNTPQDLQAAAERLAQ